jgi:hypothetical protein
MADETEAEKKAREDRERDDAARMDADAGTKLDKILSGLDSACARMDAMEKRMDSRERKDADASAETEEEVKAKADKARKDAEAAEGETEDEKKARMEREDKARKDKERKDAEGPAAEREEGDPMPTAADKRKDAERAKEMEEVKADSAALRADLNALRGAIRDLKTLVPKQRSDADYHDVTAAQARFDSVCRGLGLGPAPIPMPSEDVAAYKLRVHSGTLKKFSPRWKDANLYTIAADSAAFGIADDQIYNDAVQAMRVPTDLEAGTLREIVAADATGRRISTFVGGAGHTFIGEMKGRRRRVGRIRNAG